MPSSNLSSNRRRLNSWKEIAVYLERDMRTAMRWEKERGLPIHRLPGKRSGVFAMTDEIDEWTQAGEVAAAGQAAPRGPNFRARAGVSVAVMLAMAILLAAFAARSPDPSLRNAVAVTNDGILKRTLVSGGNRLVFVVKQGEQYQMLRMDARDGKVMPASGLTSSTVDPVDMSSDGLEVLAHRESDDMLLVFSLDGGEPRELGTKCGSAAWSADGSMLAYIRGRNLYLARHDGSGAHMLTALPNDNAGYLRWSPDGERLRFVLDVERGRSAYQLWEIRLRDHKTGRVLPRWNLKETDKELGGQWTRNGDYFVFAAIHDGIPGIWALRERRGLLDWFGSEPIRLTATDDPLLCVRATAGGNRLFALTEPMARGELARFDPGAILPVTWPAAPPLSATQLSFSFDSRQAAYTSYPKLELWKMKRDGTERKQLTFGEIEANLPQWSPDGSRIAFMRTTKGRPLDPSKIRIVNADGGSPEEPVKTPEWQGVPSWTPDGSALVFGENDDVAPIRASCRLHLFNFKTGQTEDLPGTTGLWTARMCPTGRYVAAETRDKGKLVLYDLQTGRWSELASFSDSKVGDNPVWSRDGKYVYVDAPHSPDPAIYRIRMADKHRERMASLKGLQRPGDDNWIGLGTDGSLLITRRVQGSEIRAWDWVTR